MDLTRLRYFQAVAEELHFGRAAERLHMAQPPLSRQIRALEQELEVDLFERTTRTVHLTEAGRLLYPPVRQLLLDAAALERRVADFRSGEGGILRLGFVDSSSYETMPRFLRAHRTRWPAIEYELTSMSSDEQLDALEREEIDLGIGRTLGNGRGIHSTLLHIERLVVAVSADHPFATRASIHISESATESFIGFDRRTSPSLHAQLRGLFASCDVDYDPIIEATEYTTILGLVASGQGIAVVPAGVQSFAPANLRYIELDDVAATSELLLLTRDNERSPLVKRAIELADEVFPG